MVDGGEEVDVVFVPTGVLSECLSPGGDVFVLVAV